MYFKLKWYKIQKIINKSPEVVNTEWSAIFSWLEL